MEISVERKRPYDQLLQKLPLTLPGKDPLAKQIYHLYVVRSPKRDSIIKHLSAAGVATGIYYPLPLHLQRAFRDLGYKEGDFSAAEQACKEAFAIPCYPELTNVQQQELSGCFKVLFVLRILIKN